MCSLVVRYADVPDNEDAAVAQKKCARYLANPASARRGRGAATPCGVAGVPCAEGYRAHESEGRFVCDCAIQSKQRAQTAMKTDPAHGTTAHVVRVQAMGEFGQVFQHSAASSSSHLVV